MEVTSRRRCGNYHQGATQSSPSTIYHRSRRRRMRGFSPLLINSMQAEGFLLPTLSGRFDVVPPNDDDCPLSAGAAGSAPTVPTGLADLLGIDRGRLRIARDFNAPLPDKVLSAFAGAPSRRHTKVRRPARGQRR